jgi:hypothetical protein
MAKVSVSHCSFLTWSNSTKIEGWIVAAQIKSIMPITISGPDPGPLVIFLSASYTHLDLDRKFSNKHLLNPPRLTLELGNDTKDLWRHSVLD